MLVLSRVSLDPAMMDTIVLEKRLKIGEVAVRSGISVKTIRYYEDIGLLAPTVERSDTGYRLFQQQALKRLEFIKCAQSLGLRLQEIQALLAIHDQGDLPCPEVKQQLQAKSQTITTQIEALENLKAQLQRLLSTWEDQPPSDHLAQTICPNIQLSTGRSAAL